LLLGLVAVWASGVFKVKTPHGTLVLEDLPENAVVEVDGEKKVIITSAEGKRIELKVGPHGVIVKHNGVVITSNSVTIESGREFKFTVRREALPKTDSTPIPDKSAVRPTHVSAAPKTDSTEIPDKSAVRPTQVSAAPTVARSQYTILSGQSSAELSELLQKSAGEGYRELMFGDTGWTNYDFSVDAFRVLGDSPFSLFFRSTDQNNEFEYSIAGDGNKRCYVMSRAQGGVGTLKNYGFSIQNGVWYTARVHVRGDHFVASIFDNHNSTETRTFDVVDGRHPRGRVGLRTFGSTFRFKNIKVTHPDGRTLWEVLPEVGWISKEDHSDKSASPAPVAARGGFVPLLNGRDIAGWTAWGMQGRLSLTETARTWWVRDGVLHGSGGLSHLFSPRGDYRNFRVRAEVKINDRGNSGIFVRVAEGPGFMPGYEAQINSSHDDPNKTGSLYRVPLPPIQVTPSPVPPDTWCTLEVEVLGARIQIWVDGQLYVDWTDPRNTYTRGHIALQARHPGSEVEIRKLDVLELGPSGTASAVLGHPADAKEFRGKFYKVYRQQLSWREARFKCQELGGHLSIVKSEDENRFLSLLMKSKGVSVVWLGATDEKAEGSWVWVDGDQLGYTNWNPTQPNNKQGQEHYMVMIAGNSVAMSRGVQDGKWHDQPNVSVQWSPGFICQWD
jgi:hypothetical protein